MGSSSPKYLNCQLDGFFLRLTVFGWSINYQWSHGPKKNLALLSYWILVVKNRGPYSWGRVSSNNKLGDNYLISIGSL